MSTLPILQQLNDSDFPKPDGDPSKDFFSRLHEQHGITVDEADRRSPLGEGGFSFVYKGHSEALGRDVAVKKSKMPFELQNKWFQQEYRATCDLLEKEDLGSLPNLLTLLKQPKIVEDQNSRMYLTTVWELGQPDNTLKHLMDRNPDGLSRSVVLQYMTDVAKAVEAIAKTGRRHGDIKPANVMLFGDQAKLADFGTMRPEPDATRFTTSIAGTPEYMPPEAQGGDPQESPRTFDLYSFGVMYASLRKGGSIFRTDNSTGQSIVSDDHRQLENIDLTFLDTDEAAFVGGLIDPDRNARNARPLTEQIERLTRAQKKVEPTRQRKRVSDRAGFEPRLLFPSVETQLRPAAITQFLRGETDLTSQSAWQAMLPVIEKLAPRTTTADGRRDHDGRTIFGHTSAVRSVAVSPDGTKIVSASEDSSLKVWELGSGECLQTLAGHTTFTVRGVAISPDGTKIVSASGDRSLKVWELGSGECLQTLAGHTNTVHGVAISSDRTKIVSASDDKSLKVWELGSGECLQTLAGHRGSVRGVAISPDGTKIVSASTDDSLRVWELGSGECLQTLTGHEETVVGVAISPDGTKIVSASDDDSLKIWELSSGECLQTLSGHGGCVNGVAISPDGTKIVSASTDRSLKVWQNVVALDASAPLAVDEPDLSVSTNGRSRAGSELVHFPTEIFAGELFTLGVHAGNRKGADLERVLGRIAFQQENNRLATQTFIFGRVAAGQSASLHLTLGLAPGFQPQVLEVDLEFEAVGDFSPPDRALSLDVLPLPRPDFPVSLTCFPNKQHSAESHTAGVAAGSVVDVEVSITNDTGETIPELFATLRLHEPVDGIKVNSPEVDFDDDIEAGSSHSERLTFSTNRRTPPGPVPFEVTVETPEGRVLSVIPFEIDVSEP